MFGGLVKLAAMVLVLPFVLLWLCLFLWALLDCVQREFKDSTTKIVWALVIIFVHVLGPIVYLIAGRQMGTREGPGGSSA